MGDQQHNDVCGLFKVKFYFDDRAIAPWKDTYLIKEDTAEYLKNSWGPSAYLHFDVVDRHGEFEKVEFINSAFVVSFEVKPYHD